MSDLAAHSRIAVPLAARRRSGAAAHLCDHLPPGRRQDHADRKAAAVRRRHQSRRPGQGQGRAAQHPFRLDEDRARARHLGRDLGDDLRVRGPRVQPAGHAGPRGLFRRHLPHADRGRFRRHGDRRRQGHRGADAKAVRGLPPARHPDHHLHQQDGPREPRHLRAARRDREDAGARHHADDLAGRPRPRLPRHLRYRHRRRAPARRRRRQDRRGATDRHRRSRRPQRQSRRRRGQGRTGAGVGSLQAVRARGVPRGPSDAGLFRQRAAQFRRRRPAGGPGQVCAAAARAGIQSAQGRGSRAAHERLRVQDPGQHGSEPPRPHRLRAAVLGQAQPRHEGQAGAHRQEHVAVVAAILLRPGSLGGGRGLCRRRRRHSQSRHACGSAIR